MSAKAKIAQYFWLRQRWGYGH